MMQSILDPESQTQFKENYLKICQEQNSDPVLIKECYRKSLSDDGSLTVKNDEEIQSLLEDFFTPTGSTTTQTL